VVSLTQDSRGFRARDNLNAGHEYSQHGSTEETGESDRAESVAPACELRENNNTLTTIRVKQDEARL
jgi:hypothetical protein